MQKIDRFREENYFLSNMYPCRVVLDGMWYQSSEAAYQASKCDNPNDRQRFTVMNGFQAKKQIKTMSHKADFSENRLAYMATVVLDKFRRNPELLDKLLDTGYAEIEEGNTWHDTFWGVDKNTGQGENWLGKILASTRTLIRDELKATRAEPLNGNISVSYEHCGETEAYTVDIGKAFPPYQSAVKPEHIRELLENQMAVLTGQIAGDGNRYYPVMQFNPELTDRLYNNSYRQSISPEAYQFARQKYHDYEAKYVQVQNYEFWLGVSVNENQLVRDIDNAESGGSRYPFRHIINAKGGYIDYAIENISPDNMTVAVSLNDRQEEILEISRQGLAGKSIGTETAKALMNEYQKRQEQVTERT